MSVQLQEEIGGKLLIIHVSGVLSKQDYAYFVPEVERLIKQEGKICMLFDMHDFHGWSSGALWEDTKFAWHHYRDVERIVVIGETAWQHGMAVFCKPFTTATVRYFDHQDLNKAVLWLVGEAHAPSVLQNLPGVNKVYK